MKKLNRAETIEYLKSLGCSMGKLDGTIIFGLPTNGAIIIPEIDNSELHEICKRTGIDIASLESALLSLKKLSLENIERDVLEHIKSQLYYGPMSKSQVSNLLNRAISSNSQAGKIAAALPTFISDVASKQFNFDDIYAKVEVMYKEASKQKDQETALKVIKRVCNIFEVITVEMIESIYYDPKNKMSCFTIDEVKEQFNQLCEAKRKKALEAQNRKKKLQS